MSRLTLALVVLLALAQVASTAATAESGLGLPTRT
jgi:hypothetical protein